MRFSNSPARSFSQEDVPTQYEVESAGGTLSHGAEEKIEADIDRASPDLSEEVTEEVAPATPAVETKDAEERLLPLPRLEPLGEPVQPNEDRLRIGFVTDTHVSSETVGNTQTKKLGRIFIDRIDYIVRQMNDVSGPDFIVVNGDVIEDTKIPASQGRQELSQTKALFDRTTIPKYWVIGNHDVRSLTKAQWKETLGIGYTRKSFRIKGYKIILLDSNFNAAGEDVSPGPGHAYTRGNVSAQEIEWLKRELESPEKKIAFLHHPPRRDVPSKSDGGTLKNSGELRDLFSDRNVLAVFAGHTEDLYSEEENGVRYFIFPGLTKNPAYPGNFVTIDVEDNEIEIEMSFIGKNGKYTTIEIEKE